MSGGAAATPSSDVAIVGGGIMGCAAAAFLAEAGLSVALFERDELAGAASGRNSGSIQHPFDAVLAELHFESLCHYAELEGFHLPGVPAGVLMLATQASALEHPAAEIAREQPELRPSLLDPGGVQRLEPGLGQGLWGCRLETGYPVRPAGGTLAFAERARRAGATLHEGREAQPWLGSGVIRGVLADGEPHAAGAVLVCAGPWTPQVMGSTLSPRSIVPVWGVVVDVSMDHPPRHVVEQLGVEEVVGGPRAGMPGSLFSLVAADGVVSLGSTFLADEPDPAEWIPEICHRAERFVPALAGARVNGARACARPLSLDGRPLIGEVGAEGLWVAAGHGPWGISTGPATARLAVDALLGRDEPPDALLASRFETP